MAEILTIRRGRLRAAKGYLDRSAQRADGAPRRVRHELRPSQAGFLFELCNSGGYSYQDPKAFQATRKWIITDII